MMKFNKKEKVMFWSGISIGIIGGVIGNLWAGSYFDWVNNVFDWVRLITFIIFSLLLLGALLFIKKTIKNLIKPKSQIKK